MKELKKLYEKDTFLLVWSRLHFSSSEGCLLALSTEHAKGYMLGKECKSSLLEYSCSHYHT
jgi:hypothetical protein